MKQSLYILIVILICSCENAEAAPEELNKNEIDGFWKHDNEFHNLINKEFKVPKGNLTGPNAFGEIKMFFNQNDSTYISYFDNSEYIGKWKIEDNLLYMQREGQNWIGYEYRLSKDSLIIIDREWLMTFIKINKR